MVYQLANIANPSFWKIVNSILSLAFSTSRFLLTVLSCIDIGHPTTRILYPTYNINKKGIGVFSSLDLVL